MQAADPKPLTGGALAMETANPETRGVGRAAITGAFLLRHIHGAGGISKNSRDPKHFLQDHEE